MLSGRRLHTLPSPATLALRDVDVDAGLRRRFGTDADADILTAIELDCFWRNYLNDADDHDPLDCPSEPTSRSFRQPC